MRATATARANMALVKYWGKRDEARMIPQNDSIAVVLDGLRVTSTVELLADGADDEVLLDGEPPSGGGGGRARRVFDAVRERAGIRRGMRAESRANFPVGAGLAGSAAGFAALARAAAAAAGLELGTAELSGLARLGSGSATRSIPGGFTRWNAGSDPGGRDSVARSLFPADHWDLRLVIGVCEAGEKEVSSTEGMRRAVETSPYYDGWLAAVDEDLAAVEAALADRDLARLGPVVESNCLRMHALAHSSRPPVLYWLPATLGLMDRVARLRADGLEAWYTIDAGPHVAVLCEAPDATEVAEALGEVAGVGEVRTCRPGPGARLVDGGEAS